MKLLAHNKMIREAALGILLVVCIASIDAFPKNRLDRAGKFLFLCYLYFLLRMLKLGIF